MKVFAEDVSHVRVVWRIMPQWGDPHIIKTQTPTKPGLAEIQIMNRTGNMIGCLMRNYYDFKNILAIAREFAVNGVPIVY